MKYKKPTPQDLRRVNRAEILRKIYFEGPISRLEVSQQIGISPATVTNIVNALLEKKILIESGIKRSEGGRPSTLITINPDYGYFFGIEVGETFIQVELFDILFNSCQGASYPLVEPQINSRQIVSGMLQGIEEVMKKAGIQEKDVIGAGIGFPGMVDPAKGVSIFTPNWGWHNVSITSALRKRLSIPMYLDNGAKAMAMGEALFGAGRGVNNLAVLLVGTGVGSGIITGRELFRGSSNNAGEFGHTTLNVDGPLCRCGSHGCMEVYIGANGIIDRYCGLIHDEKQPSRGDQAAFIQYLIAEAERGKPEAVQTIDETIRYLGVSIANLINAVNPELLLLGGWSGLLLGVKYLTRIEEVVSRYALQQSLAKTTIRLCQLGQGAVAKGAAALVLEHFFETAGESEAFMVGGEAIDKASKA
ncbi:transcriptional regulator/sugar kinase [Longilinea arvoryzae]|uniref:Transcriptional regulator/sugar kinase n=1 Tax=Longilinea arvoryzae TaxID=360412 RepID=A0A0S7BG72_9CHLR|nr:ROK family transcriptional regulator [Longilinea arvoryzae]GAP13494.1 transcriptional regulator/sugar kinase [Longilinea arvoryzae]